MKMAESFKPEDSEKKALKPGEQAGMTNAAEQSTIDQHAKSIRQETTTFAAAATENTAKVQSKQLPAEESARQLAEMLEKQIASYSKITDRKEWDDRHAAVKQVIANIEKEITVYPT